MDKKYLAGLFDGEGSISVRQRKNRNDLTFEIKIYNSSKEILNLKKEMEDEGLIWHISESKAKKPVYCISLTKMEDISKFISFIIPFLRIKKEQADTMLRLINLRLKSPKSEYNKEEIKLINKIRSKNWVAKKYPNKEYVKKYIEEQKGI